MSSHCRVSTKRVIETRWPARSDAVKAVHINHNAIISVSLDIYNDNHYKLQVSGLKKYGAALFSIFQSKLLERCNHHSKTLNDLILSTTFGIILLLF